MTDYRLSPSLESADEALDRLRRAAEAADIGTFYLPLPDGRLYWNARCKQHFWLHGHTPDSEIDTDTFYRAIHPEDREKVRLAVDASVQKGAPYDIEFRTVSPTDEVRWLRAKGSTYFEAGRAVRFDGITIDISAQKRLESERNALVESERMLRHAAQSANAAKDAFIAAVSHELRTPLAATLAWVDLLIEGAEDPGFMTNGLSVIRRNVLTQSRLVDDLLDMSRIGKGKFALNRTPVAIADCVNATLQDIRPIADKKGVFVADLVAEQVDADVYGDGPRLCQVFGNLLNNALKHTERGGKIMPSLVAAGRTVRISIADTGTGIPRDRLNEIFQPFNQIESAVTTGSTGLGLGLSIARSIVLMHGGEITAESAGLGKGATFTVVLPLAGRHRSEDPLPDKARADGTLKGKTVLLIDDDPDTREALAMVLQFGYATVYTASSAEEAHELVKRATPDAIVSDLSMPGEDGYSFVKRLRKQGLNIPVIALTGHVRTEDEQQAKDAGFDACLGKPVEPALLLGTLGETLAMR